MAVKILLICFVGLVALVCAQDDGRYRPGGDNGRYRGSNDGKYSSGDGRYVHDDVKYQHTADKFGANGNQFVNIGGNRPRATKATTTTPRPPPPSPPAPPVFFIDTRAQAGNVNNDPTVTLGPAAADIKILRQEQDESENGYHYLYETENGILAEQSGQIEKTDTGDDALITKGFYQYTGDDGKLYRVDYIADINGFVASADHLPTPPPIPPEIQALLRDIANNPPEN